MVICKKKIKKVYIGTLYILRRRSDNGFKEFCVDMILSK